MNAEQIEARCLVLNGSLQIRNEIPQNSKFASKFVSNVSKGVGSLQKVLIRVFSNLELEEADNGFEFWVSPVDQHKVDRWIIGDGGIKEGTLAFDVRLLNIFEGIK